MSQFIPAARAAGTILVDGRLDETSWAAAPVFSDFVQLFPQENTAPTERTEVRVLFDDKALYVGVICHDSKPSQIVRTLGRRDSVPASDKISIFLDSRHDHQTAYKLTVNAAGVLGDTLVFSDDKTTDDWDAVWNGAAADLPDGWSAELAIPLALLRFPLAESQTWGFAVFREIASNHEIDGSTYIPLNARGEVSRLGHVTVPERLRTPVDIEVIPFAAARAVLRPQYSDELTPLPRLLDPSADVGLDIKAALTSALTLNATVNPDFGQVEADQLILNLSNQEPFFPEKRPFFLQGMELFQPVGMVDGIAPQMLFYSRRIGLGTPILAAAKVTGAAAPGLEVGMLDALVMGPWAAADEANPDRRLRLHLERPLHLGPQDELPAAPVAPENFMVAVVRQQLGGSSSVGARFAAGTPLTPECTGADAALDPRPARCAVRGGNALAVDWDLRTPGGEWALNGQIDGSQSAGGPPARTLRDGTVLERGATGLGAYLNAGKYGGEPFRIELFADYQSPRLDLNATGFLQIQNIAGIGGVIHYVRPSGWGALRSLDANVRAYGNWSTDGRGLNRYTEVGAHVEMLLPSFDFVGVDIATNPPPVDLREISSTGIPFERPGGWQAMLFGRTDPNRLLSLTGSVRVGGKLRAGPDVPAETGWGGEMALTFRPRAQLETKLSFSTDYTPHGPRWLGAGAAEPGQQLFGTLHSRTASITLRQQLVLTPRLTFQLYGQLFTGAGQYGPFFQAVSLDRAPIRLADLSPATYGPDPSFHTSSLNLDAVLRWEYRLGSTLYLVYTRAQEELPAASGQPVPATWLPVNLAAGRATDALLLKWSYWWSL